MSVLDRAALEDSPLADLHAIASELSIDGYRRLRREQLIDAILDRQQGTGGQQPEALLDEASEELRPRRRRGRRGGRGRGGTEPAEETAGDADEAVTEAGGDAEGEAGAEAADEAEAETAAAAEGAPATKGQEVVEGEVELLPNGSGFLRVNPPEPSDADVYVSAAQVKRCELISGDRVSGPRRAPRRSERFASLLRIDSVNGHPAEELGDRARFDDLPAVFPEQRLELGVHEPALAAIDALAPIGKGSRVTIAGGARAGKTLTLQRIARVLARDQDLQLFVVLAGVRPEEVGEWAPGPKAPEHAVSFAASSDVQDQAVSSAIDQARRLAARGMDVVVLIDTLDGLHPPAARRALAAARNIAEGGSLTVIATAVRPFGGETTVIALDAKHADGPGPALLIAATGTLRAELLVGEEGAAAISRTRKEAAAADSPASGEGGGLAANP